MDPAHLPAPPCPALPRLCSGYFTGQHWVWIGLWVWGLGSTLLNTTVFCLAANYVRRRQVRCCLCRLVLHLSS